MATCKLNATQFAELGSNAPGIYLVYAGKEGKDTAQRFFGENFEAKNGSENELFRVWKNVVLTIWQTKKAESDFKEANNGIACKFRASTPSKIVIRSFKGTLLKVHDLEESVWSKIGLVPTKKDFERLTKARDYNKAIHAATKASFDTLGFRVDLAKKLTPTLQAALDKAAIDANIEIAKEEAKENAQKPSKRRGRRTKAEIAKAAEEAKAAELAKIAENASQEAEFVPQEAETAPQAETTIEQAA